MVSGFLEGFEYFWFGIVGIFWFLAVDWLGRVKQINLSHISSEPIIHIKIQLHSKNWGNDGEFKRKIVTQKPLIISINTRKIPCNFNLHLLIHLLHESDCNMQPNKSKIVAMAFILIVFYYSLQLCWWSCQDTELKN